MELHQSSVEHSSINLHNVDLENLSTPPSIERLLARREYLEQLNAFGTAAALELRSKYDAEQFFVESRSQARFLLPEMPSEVLNSWYERRDGGEALRLYYNYRDIVPLIGTKALNRELAENLIQLEGELKDSLRAAVEQEQWGSAHAIVTTLEELHLPKRDHPRVKDVQEKQSVEVAKASPPIPEEKISLRQQVETEPLQEVKSEKGLIYRSWVGVMQGLERVVGFDKRKEVPIWWETISTPPTFSAQDIRHGAVFGSGMELIEQASVGVADLLKGLGGGIAASWISVPLELTWSWFWEGPEGVKQNLSGCGHNHGHDHAHHGCDHTHHLHEHDSHTEEPVAKKGIRGFFREFGEKWHARSGEVSKAVSALLRGTGQAAEGVLYAVTHPRNSFKFLFSLATSSEARQKHIAPATQSFEEGFARAMGIITPVLGHKLFDGTGIVLGHLAFASVGLPTWIGAMVGNVLFSMPYHVLSASFRNRYREIAATRQMRERVREAEEKFQEMNGSLDRLLT